MPALPSNSRSRRKGATPITKPQKEDVWQRTLDLLGVESLNEKDRPIPSIPTIRPEMQAEEAIAAGGRERKKLELVDLPAETQKEIFGYSTSTDLIALSLVSKHFRNIAAEHLYRSFHIVFPDDEDPSNDSPIDGLAGGLDTFVTSEYDYAKYLREIILETLSPGNKGEQAYRHYLYDVSCGKFMNTLLLLTLRKAKALETFRWDIRVELSRQVFKALHQIRALQHLHLRMQVGQSIYQTPPALPTSAAIHSLPPPGPPPPGPPPHHNAIMLPPPPMPPGFGGNSSSTFSLGFSLGSKIASKAHQKSLKALLPGTNVPPTLSGFKNLKTLSILDMDTYEYIDEIKTCLQNSSSTLSTLQMSFSESLANKSRKPPPEVQSDDDSDQEDEFGQLIPPGPPPPSSGASDPNGPSKVLKAQEEKKKQEAVLGKIFGLEPVVVRAKPAPPSIPMKDTKSEDDPKKRFIRNLAPVAARLMAHVKPGSDLTLEGKETLAMIEKAARQYMDAEDKGKGKTGATSAGSSTPKATPASSNASMDGVTEDEAIMSGAGNAPEAPGLFDEPQKKKKGTSTETGVANPDDIDIEEPEGEELAIEFDTPPGTLPESNDPTESPDSKSDVKEDPKAESSSASSPIDSISWANKLQVLDHAIAIRTSHDEIQKEGENLRAKMEAFKKKLQSGKLEAGDHEAITKAEAEFHQVARRVEELSRHMQEVNDQMDDLKTNDKSFRDLEAPSEESVQMSEYVRSTRGLTLNTLAVYLIPIKASVLARAIDLSVLQSITLLNVGPQIPFWNLLARENKLNPLTLCKIHTDNVTLPFLAFVSQLQVLEELYMLERTAKARVESTAAKTTVTIEQIRRVILKRHAGTLKVLMIRNDAGSEWDLNVKTVMLLCQRATKLEELAVSFGIRSMHTLLQFFHGLSSLRALHTIQFRTDDTCLWVMREFRKFAVDNISHHPEMKLEYLALDTNVERLVRRKAPKPKTPKDIKGKGKESSTANSSKLLAELVMGPGGTWPDGSGIGVGVGPSASAAALGGYPFDWQDSSDDEGESGYGKTGLRIETVDGVRFCDVVGVKIFEKEILGGRL